MRTKLIYGLLITCISFLIFYACQKDSSNPSSPSNFSGKGADYFPISSGKMLSAKVSGATTTYDSLGNATDFTQISNQIYSCSIAASTIIRNMNANPIFAYDNNVSQLVGYIANINSEIIGFSQSSKDPTITVLPSDLIVGKEWIVNPQNPLKQQIKVKIIEALNSYTNSAGNSYQNVINLYIAYKDSTNTTTYYGANGYYKNYSRTIIDANVYFSKGIGLVGAKLNNGEQTKKYTTKQGSNFWSGYTRKKANGMIGIVN